MRARQSYAALLAVGIEDAEEVGSPDLAEVVFAIAFLEELDGDADHVVAALAAEDTAATVEVTAYAHVVDACYAHAVVDMCNDIVDAGLLAVRTHVACEDADLDDTAILGKSAELVVVEVAVVEIDALRTAV